MHTKQTTILIVDDEEPIRQLLYRILLKEGYQCETAEDAEQAMHKMRDLMVDLVILDIKMPGKSGVEILPEITNRYPDTAVIMATCVTNTEIAVQCMKQGAHDYLTKPFHNNEVVLSVSKALEKRSLKLENREYLQNLEREVEARARKTRLSFLNTMTALVDVLEGKDIYVNGHSKRVAELSVVLANELDIAQKSIEQVLMASLLHDIGKIGVRETVLNKSGKLTSEEFDHVKEHCEIGENILRPIVEDEEVLKIIRHHHERYDGNGYPDGLSGREIPSGARILKVVDAYDAMISNRPFRIQIDIGTACEELVRDKGTHFDPDIVDALVRIMNKTPQEKADILFIH
ncbi:HD domain-containing phosphohydrolase [Chloroflexota bacterium]